ncbi:14627_t:CDS:1, partial [Dentiscutata heterogama]
MQIDSKRTKSESVSREINPLQLPIKSELSMSKTNLAYTKSLQYKTITKTDSKPTPMEIIPILEEETKARAAQTMTVDQTNTLRKR